MKKILIFKLLFMVLCHNSINLQSQTFDWIHSSGYAAIGRSAASDQNGNIYFVGEYYQNISFGDFYLTAINADPDLYLAKYNTEGICEWALSFGCYQYSLCYDVEVDENNDVYIVGMFADSVQFGDYILHSDGYFDIFLSKFNLEGQCLWAIKAGGEHYFDHAIALDFDSENNVYITGTFDHTAQFGDTIVSSGVSSTGNPNGEWGGEIFLAKYSVNGDFQWVKFIPCSHHANRGHTVALDSEDNIYLNGKFEGELYFENDTLSSFGDFDIFIAKFDNNGNTLWVHNSGGSSDDKPSPFGVAIDDGDNIYYTGYFTGNADFNGTQLTSNGGWDTYITKYDKYGNLVWIVQEGGSQNERAYGIEYNNDKLHITGFITGNSIFNNEDTLVSNGNQDILLACYDIDGNYQWANNHGGPGTDWTFQLICDNSNGYYITGLHENQAVFGDTTLMANNSYKVLIAKFSQTQTGKRSHIIPDKKIEIIPNPSNGRFQVSDEFLVGEPIDFNLFSIDGKLIESGKHNCSLYFDFTNINKGVYLMRLSHSDQYRTLKVVIK